MAKVLILVYALLTSSALVALKWGAKTGAPAQFVNGKLQFNLAPFIIIGILLYGTSFVLYTFLVSKYQLGYIIPVTTALVYIVIFVASFFIFDEAFTALKIAGIILILSGMALLNIK